MTDNEYLKAVLNAQTLPPGGAELKELDRQHDKVKKILDSAFGESKPLIYEGGSKAKGTMNRESYDLDLPTYFDNDDNGAGETLEEIRDNVADALSTDYRVIKRRSALRLTDKSGNADTHIDVVPGRYFDESRTDCWIYQHNADKCRMKTNLRTHIRHIRDSGLQDAIRLGKLWKVREDVDLKTFVLELLIVDLLKDRTKNLLPAQFKYVLEQFRDNADNLAVKDPANENNDLTSAYNHAKAAMTAAARASLRRIDNEGWEGVFGPVDEEEKAQKAAKAAASVGAGSQYQPWASGR